MSKTAKETTISIAFTDAGDGGKHARFHLRCDRADLLFTARIMLKAARDDIEEKACGCDNCRTQLAAIRVALDALDEAGVAVVGWAASSAGVH